MKDKLLNGLNTFLVLDTFVVLLSFLWLLIALMGKGMGMTLGLEVWYHLWEPVFTPAIGILMGGAILSGLVAYVQR